MQETADQFAPLLRSLFDKGVEAALPQVKLRHFWETEGKAWLDKVAPNRNAVWVYGAGKAAAAMAKSLEEVVGRSENLKGFVITRRGYGAATDRVRVVEASHPVPDEDGQRAAKRMLTELTHVPSGDAVIALVSGGGSSLLSVPVKEIPFVDLQQLNRALLSCGAPIDEINVVRKHVTSTLGGHLARVCNAPICQVLISDVPGDNPSHIASGPFSPDDSTYQDASDIIRRWGVKAAHSVLRYIDRGCRGEIAETPKSSFPKFSQIKTHMLASASLMLDAVCADLDKVGYQVLNLGDTVEGEARDVARVVAAIVQQTARRRGGWPAPPVAIVSGGECTVTLSETAMRQARGGRNTEFLLALSIFLRDLKSEYPIAGLAADTDGTDGVGGHAGAFMLPGDFERCVGLGISPRLHLDQHTSYDYFQAMGRLLNTGPTETNVNDLRVVLIGIPASGLPPV